MIKKFTLAAVVALLSIGCTTHFITDKEYEENEKESFDDSVTLHGVLGR